MDPITVTLSVAAQIWMALYVTTIVVTSVVNVMDIYRPAQHSFWTTTIMVLLNIVVPIGFGVTSGLWMFTVIGIVFMILLVAIIVRVAQIALEDTKDE